MKYLAVLLIGFLLLPELSLAQKWGRNPISLLANEAFDVEVDNMGNSYVAGYISGPTNFSSTLSVNSVLGPEDAYIAKYGPTGDLLWVKTFGGSNADRAFEIALDQSGNVYAAGQFFGQVTFGTFTLNSNGNSKDIFLIKLSPAGNVIWARSEGGNEIENVFGLCTDALGNVIMTGQFRGAGLIAGQSFNSIIDPNTNLPSFDLFLSKYTSSGAPVWAISGQGRYENKGLAVSTDAQNQIYLSGQFSDTLFFNNLTLPQTTYGLGFLSKISPNGQVQWINQIKGIAVLPNDVKVNPAGEVVVVAEYTGLFEYKDNTGFHPINNPYSNKIVTFKTNNNGNFIWGKALGSNSTLSAKALTIDANSSIYVTGYFSCAWTEIHQPGAATYNSVGYTDPYLWKVANTGSSLSVRQFGGKGNDRGYGIAMKGNDSPLICGGFTEDLFIPSLTTSTYTTTINNYELDIIYSLPIQTVFLHGDTTTNSFVTDAVFESIPVYNYFESYPPPNDSLQGSILIGQDTVYFCTTELLTYNTRTALNGPDYTYLWSNGATTQSISVSTQGQYTVLVKRKDECVQYQDTIFLIQNPIPSLPTMTDNLGLAVNAPGSYYYAYHMCYIDTLKIKFNNLNPGNTIMILGPTQQYYDTLPHVHQSEGNYDVVVSNGQCTKVGHFTIDFDYPTIPEVKPYLKLFDQVDFNDSIVLCAGQSMVFVLRDSINNPNGDLYIQPTAQVTSYNWTFTGGTAIGGTGQPYMYSIIPSASGWYTITYHGVFGYDNLCGVDTISKTISKSFYVQVNSLPNVNRPVIGPSLLCPGESVYLHVDSIIPGFAWYNPNIVWTSNDGDSILINLPGFYAYTGTVTDPITGCSKTFTFSKNVILKTAPTIQGNPTNGIICPNDSVHLTVPNGFTSYNWLGPNGDSLSLTNQLYANQQGYYYCTVKDSEGCILNTPPFAVYEYYTPYLSVSPATAICAGTPVQITINSILGSNISWINPSIGNATSFTTNQPGTYICQVSGCGITVIDSLELVNGDFTINMTLSDSILCYGQTATITATPGHSNYIWSNGVVGPNSISIAAEDSIWVTVVNSYGCEAKSDTVFFALYQGSGPPNIPDTILCMGSDLTLSISGNPVLWYLSDTTYLSTGNSIIIPNITTDTTFLATYEIPECPHYYQTIDIQLQDSISESEIIGPDAVCNNGSMVLYSSDNTNLNQWTIGNVVVGNGDSLLVLGSDLSATNIVQLRVYNACFSDSTFKVITILEADSIQLLQDSLSLCYYNQLTLEILDSVATIQWFGFFGQAFGNQLIVPNELQSGFIYVTGIDYNGCRTNKDSVYLKVFNEAYALKGDTVEGCDGDIVDFGVTSLMDSLIWHTPQGLQFNPYLDILVGPNNSGIYQIQLWDDLGCLYTDTILLINNELPHSILNRKIFQCAGTYLTKPNHPGIQYEWLDAPDEDSLYLANNGFVFYWVINAKGCRTLDSVEVKLANCDDKIPNVFTPNGDGINDFFLIDEAELFPNNTLIIVNRWGEVVLEENGYKNTFDGGQLHDGVYFYIFYRYGISNPEFKEQGYLHLIRN